MALFYESSSFSNIKNESQENAVTRCMPKLGTAHAAASFQFESKLKGATEDGMQRGIYSSVQ